MRYVWATASHRGMVRDNNEDAMFPDSSGESSNQAILIVADGMGGHVAGEVASRLAVNAAASTELPPVARIAHANRAIREEVGREPGLEGMGTTMTLMALDDTGTARIAHVGDSRAYLLRNGELRRLTEDHTVAAEYVAAGEITEDEARTHPQRHMLTRTLGLTQFVDIDEIEVEVETGDRFLLCSDGLSEMVPDSDIAATLAGGRSPDDVVWSLIEMANGAGGTDNITVIVVDAAD